MSFRGRLDADQRLVILRLLRKQISYKSNSSVLTGALDDLGHSLSRDSVKQHLHWLAEQGLVSLDEPVDGVLVVQLTERGLEVATGRAIAHGVSRPTP